MADAIWVSRLREIVAMRDDNAVDLDSAFYLMHQDRRRRYLVHLPVGYDGKSPLPVVLAFHGGLGRAEVQRKQSRMNETADRYGFAVVYPDGTGRTSMLTWNAGTCCGLAARLKVDDVGFTARMLDELPLRFPVDERRVFATGMSNGGMLCYRLGCELSDRIAAIAPVAGDMGVDGPEPKRPVALIHFHGLLDENARFDGGIGANQVERVPHRPIREGIAFWIRVNRCDPRPQIEEGPEQIVERYASVDGDDGALIELRMLPRGGHTWPGGVDVTRSFGTGPLVETVDASSIIWDFFRRRGELIRDVRQAAESTSSHETIGETPRTE